MSNQTPERSDGRGRLWWAVVALAVVVAAGAGLAVLWRRGARPERPDEAAQLRAALARAQEQRRPLMLAFWQYDCPGWERLEKDVLERGYVKQALADFEVVRLEGRLHPELVQQYSIWAYPTMVFVSPQGKVWYRIDGVATGRADELFLRQVGDISRLVKLLPDPTMLPKQAATAREAGELYMDLGDFQRATQLLARARELRGPEAKGDEGLCALEPLAQARAGEAKQAVEGLRHYLQRFPQGEHREEVSLQLGLALAEAGQKDEARKQLQAFLREFPESKRAEEAREGLEGLH